MKDVRSQRIVIVGGGTAGWMTAAALARYLSKPSHDIMLIESEEIGTIGVGEATIPYIQQFNQLLGIDEKTFLRETSATFKLGIEFVDWAALGHRYFHAFGRVGFRLDDIDFHHLWMRARAMGMNHGYNDFSLTTQLALAQKFQQPVEDASSIFAYTDHAYHLDAVAYAGLLRRYSEARGVTRIEGKVNSVRLKGETGDIVSLQLASEQDVYGDIFIDCTGFRGVLIEQALEAGYLDWSSQLPMDSAVVAPSQSDAHIRPYTIATAREAGWTWRIPLQHRIGNGHVYASRYIDDARAEQILRDALGGEPVAEPRILRFKTGHRKAFWKANCVAIGLSAGFLEPLESTSIHLIQFGIVKLLALFPHQGCTEDMRVEYNRIMSTSFEEIRDFLILHYCATNRDDTEFWRDMTRIERPETLVRRLSLLRRSGHFLPRSEAVFALENWLAVAIGQNKGPEGYNPIADSIDPKDLINKMGQWKYSIDQGVQASASHDDYLARTVGP